MIFKGSSLVVNMNRVALLSWPAGGAKYTFKGPLLQQLHSNCWIHLLQSQNTAIGENHRCTATLWTDCVGGLCCTGIQQTTSIHLIQRELIHIHTKECECQL